MVKKKKYAALEHLVNEMPTVVQPARTAFLELDQVRPDRRQPRHLPNDLANSYWQSLNAAAVLDEFQALAETDEVARESFASLSSLADSIEVEGLINPITVVPDGDGAYRIRSGERRWWAHHLLAKKGRVPGNGLAGHIEAIIRRPEDTQTVVHQLAENLHRENLSAVELAIGLAEMIALVEGIEIGEQVAAPLERLGALRKVASRPRLKEGTWAEVTRRLGKTRAHWAHYLAILRLPDDTLQVAYEKRLPEGALRGAAFEPDEDKQETLVQEAAHQKDLKRAAVPPNERRRQADPQAVRLAAEKRFTSGLRSFGETLDTLTEQKIKPSAFIKDLQTNEAEFTNLVKTARRILPMLQNIVKSAQPPAKSAKPAKPLSKPLSKGNGSAKKGKAKAAPETSRKKRNPR